MVVRKLNPHTAECLKLDIVVSLDRKVEERFNNLELVRLGCFPGKRGGFTSFVRERAEIHCRFSSASYYVKITVRFSHSLTVIVFGVCLRAYKTEPQQHSRACPRATFICNARNICRHSCGRPEVVHYRT